MSFHANNLVIPGLIVIAAVRAYFSLRSQNWKDPSAIRGAVAVVLGVVTMGFAGHQVDRARAAGDIESLQAARLLLIGGFAIVLWASLRWFFSDAGQPPHLQDLARFEKVIERLERGYASSPEAQRQRLEDLEYMRYRLSMLGDAGPELTPDLSDLNQQIDDLRKSLSLATRA